MSLWFVERNAGGVGTHHIGGFWDRYIYLGRGRKRDKGVYIYLSRSKVNHVRSILVSEVQV